MTYSKNILKIQKVFNKLPYKTQGIKDVAEYWEMKPGTIKTHWLSKSGFWSIPKPKQEETLKVLRKTLRTQLKTEKA